MKNDRGEQTINRAALVARRRSVLVCGRAAKADVWTAELDGETVVVKEYANRRMPARMWGGLQLRREARILRAIGESGVAPRLVGRLPDGGLVMTAVPGKPLFEIVDAELRASAVAALESAVERVHRLGIAHLDLRSRDNVLVSERGAVTLLDWASSMRLAPGGLLHRVLFPLLSAVDRSAVVKWRDLFAPERLEGQDLAFKRKFLFFRSLWPVNRKGLGEVDRRLPRHRTK